VLAALSTGHEIGLGLAGLAFIVFALVCAMVIPRRYPDFPGERRNLFILVCVLFFAGMLTAVAIFGKSKTPPERHNNQATSMAAPL
jgi:cytochrome c oxidase assembly factor CtaG